MTASLVLRVYDPAECDTLGEPLGWHRCTYCDGRSAAVAIEVALKGCCSTCDGHGSLKAAALACRVAGMSMPEDVPARVWCEGCGHPMSEGRWEGQRHFGVISGDASSWAMDHLRRGQEPPLTICDLRIRTHYSPCDAGCRHDGPGRKPFDDGWIGCNALMNNVGITEGFEASWRHVDVRTLGWAHDLRPEKVAVLCLRCVAARTSRSLRHAG